MSHYLAKAIKVARGSPRPQKHATLILRGGALCAWGTNSERQHAEVAAVRMLFPISQTPGTLVAVNIRIRKDGSLGIAAPCEECKIFLRGVGIHTVRYSTNEGGFAIMRL